MLQCYHESDQVAWIVMEERIGVTQLIEYIEQDDDGSYCKLMGWPPQTDLSVKPSQPVEQL